MKYTAIISVVLVLFVFACYAQATPITIQVTGTIDSVTTTGKINMDDIGQSMTGYCTYDPDFLTDINPDNYSGVYLGNFPIQMNMGQYTFQHDSALPTANFCVYVTDMSYCVGTPSGEATYYGFDIPMDYVHITLFDLCNAFTNGPDDSLPTKLPDVDFFSWRNQFQTFGDGPNGSFEIIGHIDSIQVVPEPATLALLGLGGLVTARMRKNSV